MSFPFNVRVYGILKHSGHYLLSTEKYSGRTFTKFPGGALEYGEGLIDAVKREYFEETALNIQVLRHLYTTDFFQASAFNSDHQVLSVYYEVGLVKAEKELFRVQAIEPDHVFSWVSKNELSSAHVTFPIDKYVVEQILTKQ